MPVTSDRQTVRSRSIRTVLLAVIATLLVAALWGCASQTEEGVRDVKVNDTSRRVRLVLAGVEAMDSARVVNTFYVDQAVRAALDSVPQAQYLTLDVRDSVAAMGGDSGVNLAKMGEMLKLDEALAVRAQRFGSILAVELRGLDPRTGTTKWRDLSFSFIRYRDTSGTMMLGPTLYDALRKSLWKHFGKKHTPTLPVASEPLIVTNVVIPRDTILGVRISGDRTHVATEGVKALGELARIRHPEIVAFDIASRARLYQLAGIGAVEDFMPVGDRERKVMFDVGIDRYMTAAIRPLSAGQIEFSVELRQVLSPTRDSLIDRESRELPASQYISLKAGEDAVIKLIDLAEPLLDREAERVVKAYGK